MKLISTLIFLIVCNFCICRMLRQSFRRVPDRTAKREIRHRDRQTAGHTVRVRRNRYLNTTVFSKSGKAGNMVSSAIFMKAQTGWPVTERDWPADCLKKKGMPGFTSPLLVNTIRSRNMKTSFFKSAATTGKELSIITGL